MTEENRFEVVPEDIVFEDEEWTAPHLSGSPRAPNASSGDWRKPDGVKDFRKSK